jgi:hypothetical protein
MTAGPQENQAAATAQAAGEAASATHVQWAESMQVNIGGSEVAVETPSMVDDVAAAWFGTSVHPPAVSNPQTRSPNVSDPLDNSQSQPS